MAEGASLARDLEPMFDGINGRLWEDCQALISGTWPRCRWSTSSCASLRGLSRL